MIMNGPAQITVRRVNWHAALVDLRAIRKTVFVGEQRVPRGTRVGRHRRAMSACAGSDWSRRGDRHSPAPARRSYRSHGGISELAQTRCRQSAACRTGGSSARTEAPGRGTQRANSRHRVLPAVWFRGRERGISRGRHSASRHADVVVQTAAGVGAISSAKRPVVLDPCLPPSPKLRSTNTTWP